MKLCQFMRIDVAFTFSFAVQQATPVFTESFYGFSRQFHGLMRKAKVDDPEAILLQIDL
jgi:hypothetical protein